MPIVLAIETSKREELIMHVEQSPFAAMQLRYSIANKTAGICTDCGLEDADTTRFDGMFCTGCADYNEES